MILRSLSLTNFHRFERFNISFDDRLTVLVGDNGSGKSSILRAASIALSTFLSSFEGTGSLSISPQDARLVTYERDGVMDRQAQYPVDIEATGIIGGDTITWKRSLNSSKGKTTRVDARQMIAAGEELSRRLQDGDFDLVLPLVAYYGTGRLWAKKQQNVDTREPNRAEGYRDALDGEVNDRALLAWFKRMTIEEYQRARHLGGDFRLPALSAVREAIASCFALITGRTDVEVDYDLSVNDFIVLYRKEGGTAESLPMGYLSDGYRTTMSMVADIAYRMAMLNPGLGSEVVTQTPGVVLIDEVDLHLHPRWQSRVLGDLQALFPRVQFIVTTHAPLVISSVRAQNIRLLESDTSESYVPSSEVYGGDPGRLLVTVMGAEERPKDVQKLFDGFYVELDKRNYERAESLLNQLVDRMGNNDPDIVSAQTAYALEVE
ncbi:AAA family ATPase [Collinsella intestinalis]|uniref:AAA family ATPase n=1 Tax=Collinsella intestinalis TaxID=147207 RepID=UPI0025A31474|nr:AAA family ATPase [Collinsella intestinalis]MDM8163016.1 AAA family ATPase [Collinsella intestinalis]